ncbi:PLP-dependent aminotransferase family protein [Pseudomonas aeruginosa]|nr:PLP-dependent aminotransferase family protein [Pseudomonas aeruginosa]
MVKKAIHVSQNSGTKKTRIVLLVEYFALLIDEGKLVPGARLPSIRAAAKDAGVSTFTVVQAFDRLVALGYIEARKGDGFFVAQPSQVSVKEITPSRLTDAYWLLDDVFTPEANTLQPGGGGLPSSWLDEAALRLALRSLGRSSGQLTEYGDSRGSLELRLWLQRYLGERGVHSTQEDIVLTQGASQALNLIMTYLLKEGDCVFVDDPGYINLFSNLRDRGVSVVGVPWTSQGPDLERLTELLNVYRPKVFFTNPWLQNPTGASYSLSVAHRVLQLADLHDFLIVENDVYGQLLGGYQLPLAALDNMRRVIYVGSISKTLSPSLRVGFIAAKKVVVATLQHHKMATSLYGSRLCEQVTFQIINDGGQRKRYQRLRERLLDAQIHARERFQRINWRCWAPIAPTPYIWVGSEKEGFDPVFLAKAGLEKNILLSPGCIFRPDREATPWLRFNVTLSQDERVWEFLEGIKL